VVVYRQVAGPVVWDQMDPLTVLEGLAEVFGSGVTGIE
jgi:hypothetical protein